MTQPERVELRPGRTRPQPGGAVPAGATRSWDVLNTRSAPRLSALKQAVFLGAAFALLYALTGARTVQGGDAGEFMTVAARGGVPHPPGYPLFSALCQGALALVPWGSVAWRTSLVSALCGGAALGLLCAALRRACGSGFAAGVAAASLGLTPLFWGRATVVDVVMLGALTGAGILACALWVARGARGPRPALCLGLAVASGVANHHTVVLLTPLCVYTLWSALPRPLTPASALRTIGACTLGVALGFLCYLLLMRPGGAWRWGDTESLGGLAHHFLRRDYGTLKLASEEVPVAAHVNPLVFLRELGTQLLGVLALAGAWGLVCARRCGRGFAGAYAGTFLLAGPLFLAAVGTRPEGLGRLVVARFYVLPATLFAGAVAFGLADLLRRAGTRRRVFRALLAGLLLLSAGLHAARSSHAGWTVLEDYAHNTLQSVEAGALIVGNGDAILWGITYAQEVQGLRPDVSYVEPGLLGLAWYRERLAARDPQLSLRVEGSQLARLRARSPRFAGASLRQLAIVRLVFDHLRERPVYLALRYRSDPLLRRVLPATVPEAAVLLRVLPPGRTPPEPQELERRLEAALDRHRLRSRLDGWHRRHGTFEAEAFRQYAFAFVILAETMRGRGDEAGFRRCLARAEALDPWLREGG